MPLLLVTLAITGLLVFQTAELYKDRALLAEVRKTQEPAYREARRLQDQLEGIAGGTASLALAGNPNAQLIVDALRSRGITIDPDAKEP